MSNPGRYTKWSRLSVRPHCVILYSYRNVAGIWSYTYKAVPAGAAEGGVEKMTFLTTVLTVGAVGTLVLAASLLLPFLGGFLLARVLELLLPLYLLLWFLLHGRKKSHGWEKFQNIRFAHRGFHNRSDAPENSLLAFRRAVERGYGAELDVHLTRDGHLAVLHDSALDRVCGVPGIVEDMTAAEVQSCRLLGSAERIPFLEEVLPLFEGKTPLVVELKSAGGNWRELAEKTMECLDRFQTDYCVESFDPRCLLWLRQNRPEVLRGQLAQAGRGWKAALWPLCSVRTRPDFIAYRFEDRRAPVVWLLRYLGHHMVWWTIRSQADLDWAENRREPGIFENFVPKEETEGL